MPFSLNQLQYFFQYYVDLHLGAINEMTNVIVDDVMIHGETEQHDIYIDNIDICCRFSISAVTLF